MDTAPKTFMAIGLMSGTSLDGLDIVLAHFVQESPQKISHQLLVAETRTFTSTMKKSLQHAYTCSGVELAALDFEFSSWAAQEVQQFIHKHDIQHVDVVGFHGQTIYHNPKNGYTFQLGNPGVLATELGIDVVGDFRSQDVSIGGQGAPLVPIGDQLLFSSFDGCLNLGGIANISILKPEISAFDVCPFNLVLNKLANKLNQPFDNQGNLAATGSINERLLQQLNEIDYYKISAPKSLGFEQVQDFYFPLLAQSDCSIQDKLRTYCEHASEQLVSNIKHFEKSSILVTGGGAFNTFFVGLLQQKMPNVFVVPSKEVIDFKEALIFALLAVLRVQNQTNTLKQVTGASSNLVAGGWYSGIKR